MDFPLEDCMDQKACYQKLVAAIHPDGLGCPKCGERQRIGVHRYRRPHAPDFRCKECRCVFNAWTDTVFQGTHRSPSQLLLIVRGIVQGVPTAQLARELGCDRKHLLELRHRLQENATAGLDHRPLPDRILEADEMYQNAGEKRDSPSRSRRPATAAC